MKQNWLRPREMSLWIGLAVAFLVGFILRCYLLADQVFIDDEWHGFYYAIGKTPGWLLTHFSIPGATCIPLNFYIWVLGQTVGWSETWLRLPSLICGLLCVVVCPLLARPFIDTRRTVLLAFLLAISPLLVFYSRICRPYSAVSFLAFAAILLAARWMQTGRRLSALLFIISGVLAVYFHLFAIVTVAAPFLAACLFQLWRRHPDISRNVPAGPPFFSWAVVALVLAGSCLVLVLPALIHSLQSTFFQAALKGNFRLQAVPPMLLLMSGTAQPVLAGLFWLAVVVGACEQCRRNVWLGWMLVSLFPLHALALLLSRPDSAQSTIVLTRYCIPLVPVCFFFAASGIESALAALATRITLQPTVQTFIASLFVLMLVLAGPLPQCYVVPNNFTNDGAYQHRYGIIDWRWSFYSELVPSGPTLRTVISAREVSPFYVSLGQHPDGRPIVEYPMMIGDHVNLLYYYQHFHRHPVIVGYATDVSIPIGLNAGGVYGNAYIDQVLSLVPNQSRMHFRNLIAMTDLAGMRSRKVEYLILHKRFEADLPQITLPLPDLERLSNQYHKMLGEPCYEDEHITVFRL